MEEKHRGKLGTILLYGIPSIMTVILVLLIMNIMGVPIGKTFQDLGRKIPIINHMIPAPAASEAVNTNDSGNLQQKYEKSQSDLSASDRKLSDVNKQLSDTQKELVQVKLNNQELQKQLDTKQTNQTQDQMKQVAGLYATMPPSKASAMIQTMSLEDASLTLSQLNANQQSSILSSMRDAKKAAQITLLLNEIPTLTATDQAMLKQQVHDLALQQENPTQTMADTLSGMPAAQSAGIIQSMMGTNSQVAMDLLRNTTTSSRSQILAEIENKNPNLAAQITANLNKQK
ncbi:MotE family protein [Neobacillus massiliamazoniensis]|uniref:FlaA locus 22.9 kDa protein ORF 6 n=1 Tax=Neobacillus massiliamazoniensis TaxID=1499688 RepID=A0A0U1NS74_9BACI|nr:hypothetical protein [Neobacillus massiliamazoniensis]CRK80906.1 FlaA locus 22.9 kDa protein ORF 6 [Neobacillus massiliamazoniensis]